MQNKLSRADDRKGLAAIERRLVDDDPALAEAFQQWQMPEVAPNARDGETTVPPVVNHARGSVAARTAARSARRPAAGRHGSRWRRGPG